MKTALHVGSALLLGSSVLFAACAPSGVPLEARTRPQEPNTQKVVATPMTSAPAIEESECPPIDMAQLEPPPPSPDTRMVALSDVFPRDQTRSSRAAPLQIDLGRVPFPRRPESGDPSCPIGRGMGWPGISPHLFDGELGSDVASALQGWSAAITELGVQQQRAYLLGRRADLIRATQSAGSGVDFRCAASAKEMAELAATKQKALLDAASSRLVDLLERAKSRTPGEKLLFGMLLSFRARDRARTGASAPGSGENGRERTGFARSLALYVEVASDPNAHAELRARAEQQTAAIFMMDLADDARGIAALKRVLTHTKDPTLRVDTLVKLADASGPCAADTATHEKLILEVIKEIDRGPHDWHLSENLAELASVRLERGDFAGARDAAVRCARETPKDEHDGPDPWGAAPTLAEALAALGGAERGVEVPLAFVGPLSLEIMQSSLARLDRDEVIRAGELLLARFPEAAEAPQVLDLLASTTGNPDRRGEWSTQRAHDYGPASPWLETQTVRLAPGKDLPALDKALAFLLAPPSRLGAPPPTTDEAIGAERRVRLERVISECGAELAHASQAVSLRIETTHSQPSATVSGANPAITRCLTRSAASHFRSVVPAAISVTLIPE